MSNSNEKKYYQFKTAMYGSSVSDIKISVTQVSGEFNFYVKLGKIPTESNYDYKSENGNDIIISKDALNFQAVGMKYVLVVPQNRYGATSSNYKFSIKYTTSRSISALKNDVPSFGSAQVDTYNYYKYVSVEKGASYTISLTSLSGDANMVVSINPDLSFPTTAANDFHSKKLGVDSINIKGDSLFKKNQSCRPSQTPLIGGKPCEIFIGVYCNDKTGAPETKNKNSCSYSLKIYNDDSGNAHMLLDGVPQKDKVMETKYMHYFMPIETERDYLYIASTAEKGDVKLYVSFADQYTAKSNDMKLPDSKSYTKAGKSVAHSQTIHYSKKQLKKECSDYTECIALIAVEGKDNSEFNEFTIVAYTHIPRLIENRAMVATIGDKQMTYFTYKTYCTDCTVMISASAYSIEADIDLYINFGHKKDLPTKDNYDIKSETWFNEHVEIDLNHEYMKKQKIKSMNDVFIIGVYAKEAATVSIEVEETVAKVKKLKDGKSVKVDQEANEFKYFEYQHTGSNGLKFEITGVTGYVDVRINKYETFALSEPEHKYLPKNDRNSIWRTNTRQNATIKIETDDDDYCTNCIYLLGVESNSGGAKYMIEVQEEEVLTTKQISLGVPIKDSVAAKDYKQYMFVLDKQKKFMIACPTYLGKVEFSVSSDEDFDDVYAKSDNGNIIIDDGDVDEFEIGENVYIRVHGLYDTSEFILLVTHHHSYSILPDSYTQEFSINPYDAEGINMIYYPPSQTFNLFMQVMTLEDGVAYKVYLTKQFIKDIKTDNMNFPDKSDEWFSKIFEWDHHRGYFSTNIEQIAEQDDDFIYLIHIVPEILDKETLKVALKDKQTVKFTINMNSNEVNILSPNIVVENSFMSNVKNHKYFKFFADGSSNIEVILTPCICDLDMFLYKDLDDAFSSRDAQDRTRHFVNGQKKLSIPNAGGPYFIRISEAYEHKNQDEKKNAEYCAFQILYQDREHPNYQYSVDQYVPENNGVVDYYWPNYRRITFKWGNIIKESPSGNVIHPSIADVWLIKNPNIYMNSVCGMKHAEKRGEAELIERGNTDGKWKFNPRHNSFTRKGKYATFTVLASVNSKGAVVPYQPVRLWVGIPWWRTIPWTWYILFVLFVGGLGYAAYHYRKKAVTTQKKLDFEMNDIRNVARVGYADDTVEKENLKDGSIS